MVKPAKRYGRSLRYRARRNYPSFEEDVMVETVRRPLAAAAVTLGVPLAAMSAGPWAWGLGSVVGAVMAACGVVALRQGARDGSR